MRCSSWPRLASWIVGEVCVCVFNWEIKSRASTYYILHTTCMLPLSYIPSSLQCVCLSCTADARVSCSHFQHEVRKRKRRGGGKAKEEEVGVGTGGGEYRKGGKSGAGEGRREVKSRQEEGGNNKGKEGGRNKDGEEEVGDERGQGERRDGVRIKTERKRRGGRDKEGERKELERHWMEEGKNERNEICCSSPLSLQGWMGWALGIEAFEVLLCHTAAPRGVREANPTCLPHSGPGP